MEFDTKAGKVLSAFNLWENELISDSIFYEALTKIKTNTNPTKTITNEITQGQKNYILKLQAEGKIPKSQSLNISKSEAQILIKEAVEKKQEPEMSEKDKKIQEELIELIEGRPYYNRNSTAGIPINLKVEQEEREKSLYEGGENY
jgi:hypothetical protein